MRFKPVGTGKAEGGGIVSAEGRVKPPRLLMLVFVYVFVSPEMALLAEGTLVEGAPLLESSISAIYKGC